MSRFVILLHSGCILGFVFVAAGCSRENKTSPAAKIASFADVKASFVHPPDSARPGVYWYIMDGNLSRDGITSDLVSMKKAGIRDVIFQEVNVGVPRGKVDFLSPAWQELFKHAVAECERLGIDMTIGSGPGWTGSGGPWVRPEDSMQDLVSTSVQVAGGQATSIVLPKPIPKKPYFGESTFTPELKKQWSDFYQDVAVLAFPTPDASPGNRIDDADDKALYYRAPFTSVPGVKPEFPSPANYPQLAKGAAILKSGLIDLTSQLKPDGSLDWKVPAGNWTVMRFGVRNNGAITRPAPVPGLGFECDKFSAAALDKHLDSYFGKLLKDAGGVKKNQPGGIKTLHMDSWEMGAQNWTPKFREEFKRRRGYDPQPYYPVYAGMVVDSPEMSERFLWDLRQTAQELVIENHAQELKKYAHAHDMNLSIEPYDMNPTSDLELGAVADVPMCEFWSKGYGFNSAFSCLEATSIGHVNGSPVVAAESFTGDPTEAWHQFPGSMKNQGDWAFATGINRFFIHTFVHQSLDAKLLPGMTMGPYGVHWDRNNTFWPMVGDYHDYLSRCSTVLQQGRTVADILYLAPEGAPTVFRPPGSALAGDPVLPDRKGFNFDGCAPGQLYTASVVDNHIVFPGGASYRVLVLPLSETMTPALLTKIKSLAEAGATVIGPAPLKSPGLSNYPKCDKDIQSMAQAMWGDSSAAANEASHDVGKGKIISGGKFAKPDGDTLYPSYDATADLLKKMELVEDFVTTGPIRYTHRTGGDWDIYFVSNRTGQPAAADCTFRSTLGKPELWDPMTATSRPLPEFQVEQETTIIPLEFAPYQSYFISFSKTAGPEAGAAKEVTSTANFSKFTTLTEIAAPWKLEFDPDKGGPAEITFNHLDDWSYRFEQGIKHYSGVAVYSKTFDLPAKTKTDASKSSDGRLYLDLGEVDNIAQVRLNGKDLGVVWTSPWRVDITDAVKDKDNQLQIAVVNLWGNRLIGDEDLPNDEIKNDQWPDWLVNGQPRTSKRLSFSTYRPYKKDSPLQKSGLLGPVTIQRED